MAGPIRKSNFQKPKNIKKTLSRILSYILIDKLKPIALVVFVILSSGAGVFGTYLLKPVINKGIIPLMGKPANSADFKPFVYMIITLILVYLSGALATYIYSRIMISISNRTLNDIRKDLFNKMQDLSINFFDTHTHGELMSRFTNDVDTLREAISNGIAQLITSVITVTGTFIMMLILSPILTFLIVIMLFIMFFIVKTIGKKSGEFFKNQQKAIGKLNGYIEEIIAGQKVVKVFSHEEFSKKEFEALNENLRKEATNAHTFANVMMPILGNISYFNYAFTAAIGAILVITGRMDIGSVASFLQYTRSFSQPITQISQQFNSILAALAGAERIFEIIDEEPEVDDGVVTLVNVEKNDDESFVETSKYTGEWAWKYPQVDGTVTYTKLMGDVRFLDVDFSYEEEKEILKNISLYAKPGQKIAFVGSTGAGKTTIINLINRFYDIKGGQILYDNIDIRKIKKEDLRRSLAMVLQDTHLFTATVKENIRYGNLEASDEDVINAAKLSNAHSFIKHLPQGYDTMLTGDGANLSQGQRQLIAIARAAIANPPVLILDEATSSIDTRTEALIEKGMDELMKGRTVFVIAHRLSTVRNADAIIVLENGEIIERGSHEELLEKRGRYYMLYTGQFELS